MHPPQTKKIENKSSLFFGSKVGKPFIFSRFSICFWLLYVCEIFDAARTLNTSEESWVFSEETMIFMSRNRNDSTIWGFTSVSQFHFKEILAEVVGNNPILYLSGGWAIVMVLWIRYSPTFWKRHAVLLILRSWIGSFLNTGSQAE